MTDMSKPSQYVLPRGFRFGAAKAGLKKSGNPDFALIVADEPASAAAAYTANKVTAAPLILDKQHLRATGGKLRVAAINAGNANCAAGQAGMDAALRLPPGRGLSFLHRRHRRSASGGKNHRRAAWSGRPSGR